MSGFDKRFPPARFVLLASAMLIAHPVLSQTPENQATAGGSGETIKTTRTDTGEIVVTASRFVPQGAETATKTTIPLIETPQSISVITRDQIDLLSFIDAQQAVRYTAGVFGENYGPDPRYDFITVRGFTPRQYIDGLAVPATTTIQSTGVDLYAFQSLDILKGPSSVLYGAAPPGGILNEVSRRPSDIASGEIQVKGATDSFVELAGTATGPIGSYVDGRLTALYRDSHTDIDYTHNKRMLVAPSATLKLGDSTRLTGLVYYQYDQGFGGNGGFLPEAGTLLPNPNGQIKRSTNLDDPRTEYIREQYGLGYDLEHKFGNVVTFTSNTKWTSYDEKTPIGLYSGGGFINTIDPTLPSYYRTLQQYNFTYAEHVDSFTTDNRLSATLPTGPVTQKLLAGVDYRNVRNLAAFAFAFGGTLDTFNPVYNPAFEVSPGYPTRFNQQRLKQAGVYGQDQIAFGNLFVLLGGRYDWVRTQSAGAFGPVNLPPVYTGQNQEKFTYRAGVTYVTPAGFAPYISYATSFEPVLGTDSVTLNPYKPTSSKQIEGGVKFDARGLPSDVKLFATVAGFDIKQSNFVVAQVGQTPAFGTQGGEVEVYGGELELVARIHEQLSINASYSYNHSRINNSPNSVADVGAPLPTTPQNKASIFADYTLRSGFLAGFGGGAGVRYNSSSAGGLPSGSFPYIVTGAVTLYDAIVHYDIPGWRFAVNASNLADKTYVARCTGAYGCVYGQGRQVLGTITKRF